MKRCKSLFNISKLVACTEDQALGENASILPCYRRHRDRGYSCDDIDAASALRGRLSGAPSSIVDSDLSEDEDEDSGYAVYCYSDGETDSTASSEGGTSSDRDTTVRSRISLPAIGATGVDNI